MSVTHLYHLGSYGIVNAFFIFYFFNTIDLMVFSSIILNILEFCKFNIVNSQVQTFKPCLTMFGMESTILKEGHNLQPSICR